MLYSGLLFSQTIKPRPRSSDLLYEYRLDLRELGIDPDNKQQVLDSLNSSNDYLRYHLYNYCKEAKIVEALPILKSLFYKYPSTQSTGSCNPSRGTEDRVQILDAVLAMDGDGFQQEFRLELDSLNNYLEKDAHYYIRFASYLMKKYQDDYGFNTMIKFYTIKENRIKFKFEAQLQFLRPFYNSSHNAEVIEALRFVCREDPGRAFSGQALDELKGIPDPQFESFAYELSKTDTSSSIRSSARWLLNEIGSPLYLTSLIDALKFETEGRRWYYAWLLDSRQVWAYKYVLDLYKNNTFPADRSFVEIELNQYPFHLSPPSNIKSKMLLDSLTNSLPQLLNYNWIGNQNFVSELNEYLANAQNKLNTGDSINCARQIRIFQQLVDQEYRDSLNNNGKFVTVEGWKFLYYNAQYILDRSPQIPPDPIIINIAPANIIANSNPFTLTVTGKNFLSGSTVYWNNQPKATTFISDTILQCGILAGDITAVDSPFVTVKNPDGGESNGIRFYIKLQPQVTGCVVKLINSSVVKLTSGALQYYEGNWKDAVNNNDGTFTITTSQKTLSLRMTYEYGTQTKSNVPVTSDTVVFQTVNAQIQLQNSNGALIDTGTVQYYAGAWRNFGTTTNGIAAKELLPNTYSFRMTYAYASKDKQQDIGNNSTVVFQTVNASVQLQNSQGSLIDQGTVQYYSGAWRNFGTTINGVATKELLPNNYSFRMIYAFASKDKQQDIGTNSTVVFQTVNTAVQLQNSQGSLMDQGTVQYYSGAWRSFGTTSGGAANKELLPNNYSFRMTHEYISLDKSQDISTNNTVSFSTVLCTVRVKNSQNQPVDNAQASYYSGAWRQIGNTVNGEVTKELLPVNLTFRVKLGTVQQDKAQNLSTNNVVEFSLP